MKYRSSIFLIFLIFLTIFIYWGGLKGGFIFDDYPNLQDLGNYGTIDSLDKVRSFITNGFAGPTGRPISLLSFLIDANTWPADPEPFKYTNLMIHLLNGLLLCWCIILLLRNYGYKENKAVWIALVASSFWLLHPYFVSTTLYVVQRMAQLATLFSLIGIVGYLKYRLFLVKSPLKAYIGISFFLGVGTILATYSKENGALLPLLVLMIEFCNPNNKYKLIFYWRLVFLWIPCIVILSVLARYIDFSENPWPVRNFNQKERLLSESRILVEYLYNLYIPQIELKGLYQDGYRLSKSIFSPITTLYSIILIVVLLILAAIKRKKYPLMSLAILFFFAAHLIESTVIGLELYFEHRNYTAAVFLFLPIASGLYSLRNKINKKLVNLIVIIIISILSFFTYERVKLWSDTEKLQIFWAEISPESPRAQNAIATVMINQGKFAQANEFLENKIKEMPDSALLNLRLLLQKIYQNNATAKDFEQTAKRINSQPLDAQALQALRYLVEHIIEENKIYKYGDLSLDLIEAINQNPRFQKFSVFQRLRPYLKAKILLAQKKPQDSLEQYLIALNYYNDVEAGMMMVADLAIAKYPKEALTLLQKVKDVYSNQSLKTLKRTKKEYDFEIKRIEGILLEADNGVKNED